MQGKVADILAVKLFKIGEYRIIAVAPKGLLLQYLQAVKRNVGEIRFTGDLNFPASVVGKASCFA